MKRRNSSPKIEIFINNAFSIWISRIFLLLSGGTGRRGGPHDQVASNLNRCLHTRMQIYRSATICFRGALTREYSRSLERKWDISKFRLRARAYNARCHLHRRRTQTLTGIHSVDPTCAQTRHENVRQNGWNARRAKSDLDHPWFSAPGMTRFCT